MIKKLLAFVALSAATIFTANAQTAASAVDGKKQTLFSSKDTPSTPYRIPAIATMSNGEVIAIADYRPCGADVGNGDVDIYARISGDNGVSWSGTNTTYDDTQDVIKIADGGTGSSKGYGDAAVAADLNSGKVVVMCVGGGSTIFSSANTGTSDYLCIRNFSEDYGRTWKQTEVTPFFKGSNNILGADVASMFFGSGKLAVSKKVEGRIYGALLVRQGKSKLFGSYISYENKNYVVYSDDWGASWKLLGGGACCSDGDEPKVEELPNGDILLSSRTSGGRYFNVFNFTDLNSASGSWGSATKYSFGGSNSTNGELMLYKGLVDANGTEYNVMLQSLPTGSSRSNVAVFYKAFATSKTSWAVSDFTSGWTKGIEVDNGASAYSTMTILPNGQVGFLYEDDYDTSKADGDYSNIVYVPLTVEEITGGAFSAPVTEEPEAPAVAVETPVINPAGGEVEEGTTVTITCATDGATIYYTTDGNDPTTASAVYGGAIVVDKDMTIKAFAAKEGNYTNSEIVSATFTIKAREVVATPVINPAGGEVEEGTTVTISCATDGATIYYTTDGNEPTTSSAVYSGAITVNKDMTIKAFAAKDGYYTNSAVATATFTIKEVVVEPEVTEYPVTPVSGLIGGTTYYLATFSANENTVAPAGVSVFYVRTVSSDEVALSRVSSGKTIPAGEGVILMASSASAFNMTSTTDESNVADLSNNCLAATGDAVDFTFNVENCYALAVKGSGELKDQFAFCKVAVGTTLNGYNNRAYLDLSASGASFSNNVRVSFDGVTGIESSVEEFQEQVIYDICGRRVHEMKPGNIYIVNGRKVLKK